MAGDSGRRGIWAWRAWCAEDRADPSGRPGGRRVAPERGMAQDATDGRPLVAGARHDRGVGSGGGVAQAIWFVGGDPEQDPGVAGVAETGRLVWGRTAARGHTGGEFDPGSGSTLAACLMHASRTGSASAGSRGGRVRNTWAICPEAGGSHRKRWVIPYRAASRVGGVGKGATRLGRSLRPISWTVGSRPTVAMIGSWSERMISHTGTETRPRLLREAAARNFPQWAQA